MQRTRGAISILVAAMVTHAVAPAVAQTEPDRSTFSTHSLSQALDRAWSGPSDRRARGVRPEPQNPSLFKDVAGDYVRFFTARENYLILGVGLASSLSVKPLDQPIRESGFNTELWFNEGTALDHAFEAGDLLGSSLIQVGGAIATYGIGNWIGKPRVAELGRDLVRAQLVTQGVTQLLKYSVGRMRPDGSSQRSFPSGHASGVFASATVLNRHYGWKVGLPAFGVASYVAASRLSENKHYLSDVVFGAAIGLTAGRTVTFHKGTTGFELAPVLAPGGAGVQVSVFRRR